MRGQIFISYRREDASSAAGRLYDRLAAHFPQKIFMDIDNLEPGVDFVEAIEASVTSCDVLVAVIGKHWLNASDEEGKRRLDNPQDWVALEIGTALKRGIRVIPVLVESAVMPREGQLPEQLKTLVRRQALTVSNDRFGTDSERLIEVVGRVLERAQLEQQRKREEQERVEAEQREREENERLEAERRQKEAQDRLEAERREIGRRRQEERERLQAERLEAQPREREEKERQQAKAHESEGRQQEGWKRLEAEPQKQMEGPAIPVEADQAALRKVLAILKKRWPLLLGVGSIVAIFLLSFGLFNRPTTSHTVPRAELYAEGKRYLDAKEYTKALPVLQEAAEAGNAEAMNQLGELYRYGRGVSQDYGQARRWFQRAADAGNVWAMVNLGWLYENGRGVAQSPTQALYWYQKAVDAGASWASGDINRVRQQLSSP